jgi:hypothetical protein
MGIAGICGGEGKLTVVDGTVNRVARAINISRTGNPSGVCNHVDVQTGILAALVKGIDVKTLMSFCNKVNDAGGAIDPNSLIAEALRRRISSSGLGDNETKMSIATHTLLSACGYAMDVTTTNSHRKVVPHDIIGGNGSMKIELRTITPAIASKMLEKNTKNRRVNDARVKQYCHDMANGTWELSPTPISFDSKGELLDGQHRLLAIVMSKTTVRMFVAYDVPGDAVFDQGLPRSSADSLYLRGKIDKIYSNTQVFAVVNRYLCILRGVHSSITDADKLDVIDEHGDDILEAIRLSRVGAPKGRACCSSAGVRTGIFAALIRGVSPNKLEPFCRSANTGFIGSISESAAIVLRNQVLNTHISGQGAAAHLAAYTQMSIRDYLLEKPRQRAYAKVSNIYIFDEEVVV